MIFNYLTSKEDIFYKVIYPVLCKEFLYGDNLNQFMDLVQNIFVINKEQIEYIKEHWELKQSILT